MEVTEAETNPSERPRRRPLLACCRTDSMLQDTATATLVSPGKETLVSDSPALRSTQQEFQLFDAKVDEGLQLDAGEASARGVNTAFGDACGSWGGSGSRRHKNTTTVSIFKSGCNS